MFFTVACAGGRLIAEEARIWADKSGKYEIRATFADVVDGKVRLERPNGDISRIPFEKLSEKDQKYILGRAKGSKPEAAKPAKPRGLAVGDRVEAEHFGDWRLGKVVEIDYKWERVRVRIDGESNHDWPFDIEDLRLPGTSQRPILVDPTVEAMSELRVIRPDTSDVSRPVADGSVATKIAADPAPAATSSWQPKPVRLQGRTDFHESPQDFDIIGGEQPMALVLHSPPGVGDEGPGRIEIVDLSSRKTIATGPSLPGTERLLLSPSGKRIVSFEGRHGGSDTKGQLDFWSIDGKQVEHLVGFVPYVMKSWPNLQPEWVAWVDDEHVFTTSREGRGVLWQVDAAKGVYEIMIDRGGQPVLSPGRQQLAVPSSDGVQIFSALTGDQLATVGSGNLRSATLAYSPSGKQLAAVSGGFVDVIDVTTGEITRSFPCQGVSGFQGVWWIDEEYLFASGLLVNTPRRISAWKFEFGNNLCRRAHGNQWVLVDSRQTQVLTPLKLPPQAAVDAVNALDDEKLLAVRPGATVSIDVRINDNALAAAVEDALRQALEEAGMQVGEGGSLTLGATMKNGEREKINYRNFHDHFGKGETFEVTKRVYELQLLLDGAPIWKRTSVQSPPMHLRMERGENIRSAVARVMKPTAANFRGRLPAYVVRPEYQDPLGTSKISPDG